MSHGRNYECCSFRLHGMLQKVKILTNRPGGRFIKKLSLPKLVAERQNWIPATNFFAATKKSPFHNQICLEYVIDFVTSDKFG